MPVEIIVQGVPLEATGGEDGDLEPSDQIAPTEDDPDNQLAVAVAKAAIQFIEQGQSGATIGGVAFTIDGNDSSGFSINTSNENWNTLKTGRGFPPSSPPAQQRVQRSGGGGAPKNTGDAAKLEEKYKGVVEAKLEKEMEETTLSAQSQQETRAALFEALAKQAAEDAKGGKKTVPSLLKKSPEETEAYLEKKIQLSQLIKEAKAGATLSEGNEKRLVSVYKAAIGRAITGVPGIPSDKVKALLEQFSPAATDMAALDRNTGDWGRMDATPDELVPFVKSELPHLGRALQEAQAENFVNRYVAEIEMEAKNRTREFGSTGATGKPEDLITEDEQTDMVAELVDRPEVFDENGNLKADEAKKVLDEFTGGADLMIEEAEKQAKQARAEKVMPQIEKLGGQLTQMGKDAVTAIEKESTVNVSRMYESTKGKDGKGGYTSPFREKVEAQAKKIAGLPEEHLANLRSKDFMHAGEKVGTSPSWKPANTTFTPRDYAHRKTGKIDEFGV